MLTDEEKNKIIEEIKVNCFKSVISLALCTLEEDVYSVVSDYDSEALNLNEDEFIHEMSHTIRNMLQEFAENTIGELNND